jgi:hypothetical protein
MPRKGEDDSEAKLGPAAPEAHPSLGGVVVMRQHDRQALGGPIAVLLLTGLVFWLAWATGGSTFRGVASVLVLGGVAVVARDLARWNDRITLYEHGIEQTRGGCAHAVAFEDIERLEYSTEAGGYLAGLLFPFPLSLMLRGLGRGFSLRVVPITDPSRSIRLRAAFKSRREEIHKLIGKLQHRVADVMLDRLDAGEPAVWAPRLLIMPDGLAVLRRPISGAREPEIWKFIPFQAIRIAEIRHGHLLVRVHGRRRCAVNSRVAGRSPAGWIVFRRLLQEPSRGAPTVGFGASPPAVLPP